MVFAYAGDLWKCTLDGGLATRLTSFPGTEMAPRLSPDGKWIAFMAQYDGANNMYVMPVEGGEPKRISYGAQEGPGGGWTPDGKVMVTDWDQNIFPGRPVDGLWLIDPKGGLPQPTPLKEFTIGSMAPDGKTVAYNKSDSFGFNWRRYRGGTQGKVSIYDMATNTYSEIPAKRENNWHPMITGDMIYYVSDRDNQTVNLFSYSRSSKKITKLTEFNDADIRFPSTDGKTIVFERNGILSAYDIATKKLTSIQPKVVSDGSATRPRLRKLMNNLSNLALSPSGKRLIIEARGELFSVPARNGDTRNMTNTQGVREKMPDWSNDGQTIAYVSDATGEWEIYTMPQRGGKPTQITSGGKYIQINGLRFSPDSKKISFTTHDHRILIADLDTKKVTQVAMLKEGGEQSYDWSPDSTYIVYTEILPSLSNRLVLYRVRDGKTTPITDGFFNENFPSFDLNGKYLYFVSNRNWEPAPNQFGLGVAITNGVRVYALPLTKDLPNPFQSPNDEEPEKKKDSKPSMSSDEEDFMTLASLSLNGLQDAKKEEKKDETKLVDKKQDEKKEEPKDLKIDFDGMADRLIALPHPGAPFWAVIGINNGVLAFGPGGFIRFDFDSKQPTPILGGFSALALNADRTRMAFGLGPQVFITPVAPQQAPGQGRVNTDAVEAVVDPKAEWKQIFNEAWRYYRDRFYDPNMVGQDWNAIKKQYEAYLPYVKSRGDLNYVMGMMIGETGTGHSYVGGGDNWAQIPTNPVATLGADYAFENGKVKIAKIYVGEGYESGNRGPLSEPGMNIKEGEYLLEIDGQAVGGDVPPQKLLQGKAGRAVILTINSKPSLDGSRKVTVRPIGFDGNIRYDDWVRDNRKKVEKLSGGKIGYLHIPNTSEEGMIGFAKGWFSQSDKQAMILDERYNGGGNIPTYFFDVINRPVQSRMRQRYGMDVSFPVAQIEGPLAMLVNEYAGSGGDMLPWLFKENKAGLLIGTRTWGGLVGIAGSAPLVDGGFFTAPEFGLFDANKGVWIAENTGVDPDIEVFNNPDNTMNGRDPQLEKAVEHLLNEIKKGARKPSTKRPDFPNHKKGK